MTNECITKPEYQHNPNYTFSEIIDINVDLANEALGVGQQIKNCVNNVGYFGHYPLDFNLDSCLNEYFGPKEIEDDCERCGN